MFTPWVRNLFTFLPGTVGTKGISDLSRMISRFSFRKTLDLFVELPEAHPNIGSEAAMDGEANLNARWDGHGGGNGRTRRIRKQ